MARVTGESELVIVGAITVINIVPAATEVDDCAVTGFGDVPAAQWVQPPLTSIRVPVKAMAVWAVISVFNEEGTDKRQTLQNVVGSRLIVRRSC